MRSKVIRILALALVLSGAGIGLSQTSPSGGRQPPESDKSQGANAPRSGEKSKLEEMLAEALKNNPDIRVAAAKLAEAEAELNRTRLQVMQKIMTLNQEIESAQMAVENAQQSLTVQEREYKSGQTPLVQILSARTGLANAKAKLAAAEAELPYLLGKVRSSATAEMMPRPIRVFVEEVKPRSTLQVHATLDITHADKLRKALQTPIKVDYTDMTFDAILKDLSKKVEGLSFRDLFGRNDENKISLRSEEALPVYAILQVLSDESNSNCLFYVREYGILATNYKIPGALTVEEFLRQKPAQK